MNEYSTSLGSLLYGLKSSSVDSAFDDMISKEITIPQGTRSRASDSHKALREFLANRRKSDVNFPRVLSIQGRDFIGGSFARHTKIWPLDDIDIYVPLDGYNLSYQQNGLRLPFTVVSDGVLTSNPLLNPKWMAGQYISSEKVLYGFYEILKDHYPNSEVGFNGHTVTVRLKQGETKDEDGLGYDIVPCFLLRPDNDPNAPFYLIPNGSSGWLRTNPEVDTFYADKLHSENHETFRRVVKCIKFWNKSYFAEKMTSYYIELAIMKCFLSQNQKGAFIKKVSNGIAWGFWALNQAVKNGNQISFISEAPPVKLGPLTEQDKTHISNVSYIATEAWKSESAGNYEEAMKNWKVIYGDSIK